MTLLDYPLVNTEFAQNALLLTDSTTASHAHLLFYIAKNFEIMTKVMVSNPTLFFCQKSFNSIQFL